MSQRFRVGWSSFVLTIFLALTFGNVVVSLGSAIVVVLKSIMFASLFVEVVIIFEVMYIFLVQYVCVSSCFVLRRYFYEYVIDSKPECVLRNLNLS
jgi:hypothetical protein